MDEQRYHEDIQHHRDEKDRFFAEHPQSPIPEDERAAFEGLAYYEIDPAYHCHVALQETEPEKLTIPRSTGDEVTYERVGTFELEIPGGPIELAAFRQPGQGDQELFLPFKDATAPEETYGAGRYLEARRAHGDHYNVDFNLAYHPFCAYDDAYACPFPPPENQVDLPIRAGERLPDTEGDA